MQVIKGETPSLNEQKLGRELLIATADVAGISKEWEIEKSSLILKPYNLGELHTQISGLLSNVEQRNKLGKEFGEIEKENKSCNLTSEVRVGAAGFFNDFGEGKLLPPFSFIT